MSGIRAEQGGTTNGDAAPSRADDDAGDSDGDNTGDGGGGCDGDGNLLGHVLTFSKASSYRTHSASNLSSSSSAALPLVEFLMGRAHARAGEEERALLSRGDVAGLLLPWASRQLCYLSSSPRPSSSSSGVGDADGRGVGGIGDDDGGGGERAMEVDERKEVGDVTLPPPPSSSSCILWRSLAVSLEVLLGEDGGRSWDGSSGAATEVVSNTLTQSVLRKLVFYSAGVAIGGGGGGGDGGSETSGPCGDAAKTETMTEGGASGRTFVLLLPLFRPTLDVACQLLRSVDALLLSSLRSSSDDGGGASNDYHYQVVSSSLEWTLSLLRRWHVSNPRKSFGLLSSKTMLPVLSRLSRCRSSKGGEDAADAESPRLRCSELVRGIVTEGLFDPVHHLDGFKNCSGFEDDGAAAAEADDSAGKKRRKNRKQSRSAVDGQGGVGEGEGGADPGAAAHRGNVARRSCYQRQLLDNVGELILGSVREGGRTTTTADEGDDGVVVAVDVLRDASAVAEFVPLLLEAYFDRIRAGADTAVTVGGKKRRGGGGGDGGSSRPGTGGGGTPAAEAARTKFRFWTGVTRPVVDALCPKTPSSTALHIPSTGTGRRCVLEGALLRSLRDALSSLLSHDVYLSSRDASGRELAILSSVANRLLDRAVSSTSTKCKSGDRISARESCEQKNDGVGGDGGNVDRGQHEDDVKHDEVELAILQKLLDLDHNIFHRKLPRLLRVSALFYYRCCNERQLEKTRKMNEIDGNTVDARHNLPATLLRTYAKLRQLDHLFPCFFEALVPSTTYASARSQFEGEGGDADATSTAAMQFLLRDARFVGAISAALSRCPPGQVETLWDTCNDWIVSAASSAVTEDDGVATSVGTSGVQTEERTEKRPGDGAKIATTPRRVPRLAWLRHLRWGVDFFVLMAENLRVDGANATKVRDLCTRTMKSCVRKLVGGTLAITEGPSVTSTGRSKRATRFREYMFGRRGAADLSIVEEKAQKERSTIPVVVFDGAGLEEGLRLCGVLIDLDIRCSFWLDKADAPERGRSLLGVGEEDLPDIQSFLLDATRSFSTDVHHTNWHMSSSDGLNAIKRVPLLNILATLQQLAMHEIQWMHSELHIKAQREEQPGFLNHPTTDNSSQTRLLVGLTFFAACHRTPPGPLGSEDEDDNLYHEQMKRPSAWNVLARTVAIWFPCSEEIHKVVFLRWMFGTLTFDDKCCPCQERFLDQFREERDLALSLLNDASFFELEGLSQIFFKVGLSCMLELARESLMSPSAAQLESKEIAKKGEPHAEKKHKSSETLQALMLQIVNLTQSPLDQEWKPLIPSEVAELENPSQKALDAIGGEIEFDSLQSVDGISSLKRALNVLMLLNGLPQNHGEDVSDIFCDVSLRADLMMRSALMKCSQSDTRFKNILIEMMCACRASLARSLLERGDRVSGWLQHPTAVSGIVQGLFASFLSVLTDRHVLEDSEASLTLSTCKVVEAFVFQSFLSDCDTTFRAQEHFVEGLCCLARRCPEYSLETKPLKATASFLRCVIRRVLIILNDKSNVFGKAKAGLRSEKLWCTLVENIWKHMLKPLGRQKEGDVLFHFCMMTPEMLLITSDVVHFLGLLMDLPTGKSMGTFEKDSARFTDALFFTLTTDFLESKRSVERPTFYFLASVCSGGAHLRAYVTSVNLLRQMFLVLRKQYETSEGQSDPLLDSAFCELVKHATANEIEMLMGSPFKDIKLVGGERVVALASFLHAFRLVLLVVKGQSQRAIIKRPCKQLWTLSMDLFSPLSSFPSELSETARTHAFATAAVFCSTVIGKKDIVSLKSHDIAMMLSHVNTLFGRDGINGKEEGRGLDIEMYSQCCFILSSLLKHYPKKIYGCVPSFFSALRSLFCHVTVGGDKCYPKALNIILEKVREVTRICELLFPHRDIFKKHVIALLLDYVRALKDGMNAIVKESLTRAVYALIDVCSTFEIQQLSVMMDPSCKTMFRATFKSYEKFHQYKGQY